MAPAEQVEQKRDSDRRATPKLEDLIPIAVVIAAGCESCSESMVRRALVNGSSRTMVERTLGIVARVRLADCFVQAVGVEFAARMDKPLQAGRNALGEKDSEAKPGQCCGSKQRSTSETSRSV